MGIIKPPPSRRPPGYGSWHGSNAKSETYCQYCGNGYSRSLDNCLTCGASMYYVKKPKRANYPIEPPVRISKDGEINAFMIAFLSAIIIGFSLTILYFITQAIFQ